jgi:ABC-type nitrate/sulfonate/bicarbonate transport system substrate-binding protein
MSLMGRIYASLSALILVCITANSARGQAPAVTPAEKIVVSYPSKSITSFPILETARQKGFFQREGLNASIIYVRGGIDIKALVTGDVDYALASTTTVTAFVAGVPVRVIMSYNAHVDQGLFAQPKYRTVAQLKGQPIGSLNPGGLVDTLLRRILIHGGLQPERDVVLLNMGGTPERYGALKSGSVAAAMLSSPHSLRAEKDGFYKLAATADYVDVPGISVTVRADRIKKQPEQIKRFMRVSLRAMSHIRENRSEATQFIMREFGMDHEIAALAYNQLVKELMSPDGRPRVDGFQLIVDMARAAQKVERSISATQVVDGSLIEEVLREGGSPR